MPERVVITRRHHPLQGQQLEVLQGGKEQITIRLQDATTLRIPRHWTDADGAPRADYGGSESILTVEAVRRMLRLLEAFLRR